MSDLSSLKIDRSAKPTKSESARPAWLWWAVGAGVLLLAVAVWTLTGSGKAIAVTTATVQLQSGKSGGARGLTASGYVVPQRKASIASKATGRLVWLGVKEGDTVSAGQVIARIEDSDVAARMNQQRSLRESLKSRVVEAEANSELSDADLRRQESIYKEGGISTSAMDEVKNRLRVAKARVATAKADVDAAQSSLNASAVEYQNTRIVAPFSGTILSKGADLGEVVSPISGSSQSKGYVATLADMTTLEVEADVSEANIAKVSVDQPCIITLDAYPSVSYDGRVSAIVPTANRSKATILTKVKFVQLDKRVLPEMSAKVIFTEQESSVAAGGVPDTVTRLAVPLTAIATQNSSKGVFVVDNQTARFVEVQTGRTMGNTIEVKSGLSAGQTVVVSPPKELRDGQPVTVEKK